MRMSIRGNFSELSKNIGPSPVIGSFGSILYRALGSWLVQISFLRARGRNVEVACNVDRKIVRVGFSLKYVSCDTSFQASEFFCRKSFVVDIESH